MNNQSEKMGDTMEKEQNNAIKIDRMAYHFEALKDFEKSFYKNVYKEAYLRVDDIIKQALMHERMNNRISASLQTDFPNIVTFIGARGSGKTSVMLSFVEALKDYRSESSRSQQFYTFNTNRNIVFTCLDCIDGSLMEHGEDIFKTILAQMYQKFTDLEMEGEIQKSSDFDFRKRELLRGMEDVYRTVCDIENMSSGQLVTGEAYISSLRSFSSSQKVRKDFVDLIKKFTDLMRYNRYGRSELSGDHYVVIAIDDIDLNIQNSFSMLEKIHRYCTVPNVIVLLTLDFQQMLSIVTKHFYEVAPKVNKLLVAQEMYVRNLSMDYLEKVLPINYRIYMPAMGKNVIISKESNNIKTVILGKLYRRTGICFDSQGLKRHFYTPASMRELAGFYLMLESMGKIHEAHLTDGSVIPKEKIDNFAAIIEENYSILLSDLENRIVLEKLNKREDIRFVRELFHSDIRRAMSSVKEYFLYCVNGLLGNKENSDQYDLIKDVEDTSYGELVEIVYKLGRIQIGAYKPMVHCLLAYFSYAFTRQYVLEKLSYDKNSSQEQGKTTDKGMIEKIVGGHVLYQWSGDLIPKVSVESFVSQGMQELSGGAESEIEAKVVGRVIGVPLNDVLQIPVETEALEKAKEGNVGKLVRIINEIEFLTLFFSNLTLPKVDMESNKCPWKFKLRKGMTSAVSLVYENTREEGVLSGRGNFDVLNIIINSMYGSEKLACVENAALDAISCYFKDEIADVETIIQSLKNALEEQSLKTEYEKWEDDFGGPSMPLPLWWFDFTYNILKRTRRILKKKNPLEVTADTPMYRYTKKVYECLLELIKNQQDFYNKAGIRKSESADNAEMLKTVEQFKMCPGIRTLLEDGDQYFNMEEAVNKMFGSGSDRRQYSL